MSDRGEIIEGLQNVSHYFKSMLKAGYDGDADIYREHREAVKKAIELLKEQEPVEPIEASAEDCPFVAVYVCPGCKLSINYEDNYCWHCGRKMKWE